MSTAIQIVQDPGESTASDADQLGAQITELCSYIYAAESRLLTLICEFDEKEYALLIRWPTCPRSAKDSPTES